MPRDANGKFSPGKRGFAFRTLDLTKDRYSDELVKATFLLMQDKRISLPDMSKRAGVGKSSFLKWREGGQPTIGNLRAVLQCMGKDLAIVDKS